MEHKFVLVWIPPVILAAALRVAKRGKPDGFLLHWVRFRVRPRVLSAFPEPTARIHPPTISKTGDEI